jgi:tetratricopeptide (TPR) repeat protein
MVDLVTAEASCHPTLLYIDNIQLMNKENFIWINQLCERKSELNLGIILTRRMDYQTHEFDHKLLFSKFIRICLEDLSPDGIQQLILKRKQEYGLPESIFDQNPDLVERIARLSSGNPLFAEQLLLYIKSMNGSAHKKLQSDMSFTELPLNLNYTILARLDCMESVVKSIVQIAAVLGMEFSGSLLGTAYCTVFPADAELLKPGIELCKEEHILFLGIDGLLRFSHAMFREIIYTSISKKRLRSYHIVIAELISAIPASERESSHFLNIAEHYRRAEQPALAAENYYQYAYRLGMLGQKREAVGYYEKAIHLLTNLADRNEKLLALAMGEALHIYLYVNEIKRAYNLLSKLESNQFIKGNSEVEALVYLAKGIIADRNGDYETALKLYQDYLAKYPQSSIQESIDIYFSLGHIYNKTRDLEKALEVYEYILSTTSRENHLVLSALYGLIGGIKSKLGDQETAIQYLRWADSYYKDNRLSASRIDILGNLGLAYKYKSEYDKSYDAFQECLALAERIQVPSEIAITCNNLAILLMETNRFKESISYFDRLEAILDVVNDKALLLNAKLNRGLLLAELGKFAQAEAVLSAMIAMNKQKGFAHLKATAFFYLSLVYKRQDRSMEAIRLLNKAIVIAKKYSMGFMEVSFWVVKAEILVGMGAYQKAQPLIDAVLEQALGLGRDDCWLEAKLHDVHSKFMQSQKLDKAMIIGLLKLLPNLEDEEQIAYLHLELWQLAQLSGQAFPECGHSPEKHFQEAKQRLQSLISQAPKWEYLKRMQLLESAVIK